VQGLVAVGLGDGDEIAKPAIDRLEQRMHGAECVIALHHIAHHHPKSEHVHHLLEGLGFPAHLVEDAPGRLDPPHHTELQTLLGQLLGQLRLDLDHRLAPHHRLGANALADHRIASRVERAKTEILQLCLELVHAQTLRDRGVDFQRFRCDPPARIGLHRIQRAHVVQPVGELDQNHPQIAGHRQHHLAKTFGGGFLPAAELQLVELGDAVDQVGDIAAELAFDGRTTQ